jgi:hypothetical protein
MAQRAPKNALENPSCVFVWRGREPCSAARPHAIALEVDSLISTAVVRFAVREVSVRSPQHRSKTMKKAANHQTSNWRK